MQKCVKEYVRKKKDIALGSKLKQGMKLEKTGATIFQ
jgi:hypothetical protein